MLIDKKNYWFLQHYARWYSYHTRYTARYHRYPKVHSFKSWYLSSVSPRKYVWSKTTNNEPQRSRLPKRNRHCMPQASANSLTDMKNALLGMAIMSKSRLQPGELSFFFWFWGPFVDFCVELISDAKLLKYHS